MKRLIAFDLDGTLAESKQPIQPPMAELLARLTRLADVAVISGGDWPQFEKQVVAQIPAGADLTRLFIMPTTGTKLYRFEGTWKAIYAENFSDEERAKILTALDKAVADAGLKGEKTWGEQIEDRGSQITFSALGQQAPLDAKKAWDPDIAKRKALQATLRATLPICRSTSAARPRSISRARGSTRPMECASSPRTPACRLRTCCSSAMRSIREATTIPCARRGSIACACATCTRR